MGVSDGARDGSMASSVSNLVMSRLRSQQWGDRSAGRVRQRHELMRQRMDSQLVLVTRSTERTLIPRVRGSSDGPLVRSVSMLRPVQLHVVHMGERPRQPTRAQAARMSALHALRRSGIA